MKTLMNTPASRTGASSRLIRSVTSSIAVALGLVSLTPMVVYAASPITQYEYDAAGNPTKVTDGLGNSNVYQYDALNRPIQQNQPNPSTTGQLGTITSQYNPLDDVTSITDPRALTTSYTKNALGDVLTRSSPDTGTTTNTYDTAGNLKTSTDARGAIRTYTYDAANRVTAITYKLGTVTDETVTYTYDAGTNGKGHLTGMTDLSGSTAWSYDILGRLIRKQQRVGTQIYDLQIQYDSTGHLSRIIYPSTHYVDYQYNANGQVNQVWVDSVLMVGNIQYFPTGTPASWTWGNGQTYTRTLDSDGRPLTQTLGDDLQVVTYDNAGRISQLNRAAIATPTTPITTSISSYSYDNLDRLTNNVTPTYNQGYQYDLNGNRTQLTIDASNYAYTIDPISNRLSSEAGPTARTYAYDLSGNITGNGQDTYTYYNSGRLKQVTRASTNIYSLAYNGLGEFVNRNNNNTRYLYDTSGQLLGEYDSGSDVIQETVWLGNTPIMTLRPSALQRTADNTSTGSITSATATGTWTASISIAGYYGTNYVSHATTASTADNVLYSITPTATQNYRVYARWIAATTNATNATYTINPNTTGSIPTTVTVDQTKSGGTWNYLGSYDLDIANNLTVSLSGQGNGAVIADAVRIVPNTTSTIQSLTYFVFADYLNTPRRIKNAANQTVWHWLPELSEAFGANLPNDNPSGLGTFTYNLRFPGQLYDSASGLIYNYYRDYNSRTGRYIESDPIGLAGGINTYAYVGGNPLSYVDPLGLDATVTAIPLPSGGFYFSATGTGLPSSITGTFNTGTTNYNQIQTGTYSIKPRPSLPDTFINGLLNRNKNAGRPTVSNTDDWNTIKNSDGSITHGAQIHSGKDGTNGGVSLGCMVTDRATYNKLNKLFQDNYNNGGVKLIVLPQGFK
ncbi:hypothetical protein A7981_01935 [Methylovorus sp. MM2]|nr:hypothetical protein A7981_01935 [Methylovorus sp. MM2]